MIDTLLFYFHLVSHSIGAALRHHRPHRPTPQAARAPDPADLRWTVCEERPGRDPHAARPPETRGTLALRGCYGPRGHLTIAPGRARSLLVDGDASRATFSWIEETANGGWMVAQ